MMLALRRWFGVAVLGGVLVVAWLQARGVALLLGAFALGGPPRAQLHAVPASRANDETTATRASATFAPLGPRPLPSPAPLDPLSWPDCRDVRLTIVTQFSDPWSSRVTLHEAGTEGARLGRVGDKVAGKKLAFIGQNPRSLLPSVWLEDGEQGCQAALFAEPSVAAAEPAHPAPASGSISGLHRLSDTEVEADRELVERAMGNPLEAFGRVRFVPDRQDGSVRGLRLFGIARGSLLEGIGVKNGDRLDAINGYNVADPERALAAYARLRTAAKLTVLLQRAGKPLELNVHIR